MLWVLFLVLLILALGGAGLGYATHGLLSLSPLGVLILIVLILYLSGNLH